ncbi:MAG: DUF4412 domain-containing protein [Nitrospirales bacterium]|nr:DUF4412 domain-containing protein [Nitrospirales bacterium]
MHIILTCFFSIIGLAGSALAWEAPKVEYSADTQMETADVVMEGQVFYAPGKERREMKTGADAMTMIIRHDKKLIWTLMPEANAYMEMSVDQSQDKTDFSDYQVEQTTVGQEDVNGIKTTKSKVIMTKKNDNSKLGGFWWTTKEGIPMKMDMISVEGESKERIKMELTNLKIGKQDPKLFEVPADYMNMSMGMPNLKDLMQGREPVEDSRPGRKSAAEPKEEGFGLKNLFDLMK